MKEFKPRDKLTQRMTRDGAVLDNQTTGEEIHISERDAEKQLSPNGQPVQMGKRDAPMNPAEDVPKHGRQLRPQEQKEPEKEQPKPQQPSTEPFQPRGGSPISHIPQDIPTSAAPGGTAERLCGVVQSQPSAAGISPDCAAQPPTGYGRAAAGRGAARRADPRASVGAERHRHTGQNQGDHRAF